MWRETTKVCVPEQTELQSQWAWTEGSGKTSSIDTPKRERVKIKQGTISGSISGTTGMLKHIEHRTGSDNTRGAINKQQANKQQGPQQWHYYYRWKLQVDKNLCIMIQTEKVFFFGVVFWSDTHLHLKNTGIQAVAVKGNQTAFQEFANFGSSALAPWRDNFSRNFSISQEERANEGIFRKCYHPELALPGWSAVDAACTAGGGGGLESTETCVGWGFVGLPRHVYHRQLPHKDRFLIDLNRLGLEGSVWLRNCLKFRQVS